MPPAAAIASSYAAGLRGSGNQTRFTGNRNSIGSASLIGPTISVRVKAWHDGAPAAIAYTNAPLVSIRYSSIMASVTCCSDCGAAASMRTIAA